MTTTLPEQMKALISAIEEKEQKIKEMDSELELLCEELIKKHSPYKKGDIVNKCISSPNSGKSIVVEHVSIQNTFKWQWRIWGYVIKKDGTPGRLKAFLYTDMNLE